MNLDTDMIMLSILEEKTNNYMMKLTSTVYGVAVISKMANVKVIHLNLTFELQHSEDIRYTFVNCSKILAM